MFSNPFTLGLLIGLLCAGFILWRNLQLKWELRRFKQHLSDRIELEADSVRSQRGELETLRKQNEQLRIRIAEFNQKPDWRAVRDLEVFARAEKRMILNAPGFGAAWENAKSAAHGELQAEEEGRSLSKRVFTRLFGSERAAGELADRQDRPGQPDRSGAGE